MAEAAPLCKIVPQVIESRISHTNKTEASLSAKLPKNHLIPAEERSERTFDSGIAAAHSHDAKINIACPIKHIEAVI